MASPTMPACDRTITSPDSVPSKQLLNTSLSQLSKNLPQTTSSRATMNLYLRWLDIHRQEPSRLSEHWDNTIMHWAQSLKSRGFREREVIDELMKWKDANSPQRSKHRRYLPSVKDIIDAFAEPKGKVPGADRKRDRDRDMWRPDSEPRDVPVRNKKRIPPDSYDGPPPKNYVCNRCNLKGHHLQVCPTNMDPAYDCPPDPDYLCEVCHVRGDHFKSLCPKNTDPYSITMKRKSLGIKTPSPKRLSKIVDAWEKDSAGKNGTSKRERVNRDSGRLTRASDTSSSDPTPFSSPIPSSRRTKEREQRLQEIEDTKKRLLQDDGYDFQKLELLGLPNPEKNDRGAERDRKRVRSPDSRWYRDVEPSVDAEREPTSKRARVDESDGTERFFEMMDAIRPTMKEAIGNMTHEGAKDIEMASETFPDQEDGSNGAQIQDEQQNQKSKCTWSKMVNPDEINISSSDPESSDATDIDERKNTTVKIYCKHVQNFIRRLPKMNEEINKIKRRTALDMWKNEDQRQAQLLSVERPNQSLISGSFSPEGDAADDMMGITVAQPMAAQFDGAGDIEKIADTQLKRAQFDGAGDEMETDEKKLTSQRKLSLMGKEAVGKVKGITSSLAKDLPTFKSKDRSPYTSGLSKKHKWRCNGRDEDSTKSRDSFNSLQVNAASSFLKLTEENVKSYIANVHDIKPVASTESLSSLEVNLPGNRVVTVAKKENVKPNNNALAKYAMHQVHRSRGTARAPLGNVTAMEDLKRFGESFKLTTPIPKDVLGLLSKDPAKQKELIEKNKAQRDSIMARKEGKSTVSESTPKTNVEGARAGDESNNVKETTEGPTDGNSSLMERMEKLRKISDSFKPPQNSGSSTESSQKP